MEKIHSFISEDPSILESNISEKKEQQQINFSAKQRIIPQEWKSDIDGILSRELLSANRAHAKSEEISKLVSNQAEKNPHVFIRELRDRWAWHNEFYEKILEPGIVSLLPEKSTNLSPSQIEKIIEIYKTISLVDEATIVPSAAIKLHLEKYLSNEQYLGFLTDEEKHMLVTPSSESFWVKYHIDHLQYILDKRNGLDAFGERRTELMEKYHIGDEDIFSGRIKEFEKYEKWETFQLKSKIREMSTDDRYRASYELFLDEHPRVRPLVNTLMYDNIVEYEYLKSLVGVSGFVFRKKILQYLNETKILPNAGGIYAFDDEQVLDGLRKLKSYREEFTVKDMPHLKQSTEETCTAASVSMALGYFEIAKTNCLTEKDLYEKSRSRNISGTLYSAIAAETAKLGISTELLHSENEYFRYNIGLFTKEMFNNLVNEYREYLDIAKQAGVLVEKGRDFTARDIKEWICQNKLVVLAGQLGQPLHSVLVTGYNSEGFIIHDPLRTKASTLSYRYANYFIDTQIGKWVLILEKKEIALNELMEKLPEYENRAKEYLRGAMEQKGGDDK